MHWAVVFDRPDIVRILASHFPEMLKGGKSLGIWGIDKNSARCEVLVASSLFSVIKASRLFRSFSSTLYF
jgi:hypothetical protein